MGGKNKYNEQVQAENPAIEPQTEVQKKPGFLDRITEGILEVLGGEFLMHEKARKQFAFVFFLAGLALVYIANSYYAERTSREIDALNRELKELHYSYISSKSQLMQESKQSELARKLRNSGLKESVEPVKRLVDDKP
jgi:hypothetical protein